MTEITYFTECRLHLCDLILTHSSEMMRMNKMKSFSAVLIVSVSDFITVRATKNVAIARALIFFVMNNFESTKIRNYEAQA